jgi:hypothetical protein
MAFPLALIFSAADLILSRVGPMLRHAGVPDEAISGATLLAQLGPKAIQLIEDVNNGVAPAVIQERWNEEKAAVEAGNAAWEAAAKADESDGA